jgi:hypothetical protein
VSDAKSNSLFDVAERRDVVVAEFVAVHFRTITCLDARASSTSLSSKSIIVSTSYNPTSQHHDLDFASVSIFLDLDFASVSLWLRLRVSQMLNVDSASSQRLCLPKDNFCTITKTTTTTTTTTVAATIATRTTTTTITKMDRRDGGDKGWGSRREPQVRLFLSCFFIC